MNFQNWQKSHTAIVVAGVITGMAIAFGSGAEAYLQALPAATVLQAFSSLATLKALAIGAASAGAMGTIAFIGAYLKSFHVPDASGGGASVSALSPAKPVAIPPVPPQRNEMGRLFRWAPRLAFAVFALCLAACALFSKIEPPSATFAVCVANDAAKGDSVAVIAVDCGSDALAVIEALISSADPTVTTSKAYAEAKAMKAALARDGGAE